ncbi:hypothetical protein Mgra_00005900 [Meloidogyne graminicola]|uniref:Uncharacterized protein n=1 Tax=Meloidogyne graminicola TaxID=189291 RepID=A0A8S9ZN61_9BILA|nr:hypothetical protein Mgra_00005900 [Meloidogyne graminicola]
MRIMANFRTANHIAMNKSQSTFIKIISSPPLFCFLIFCTMFPSRPVIASSLSYPRYFLSCRVIIGICQGDVTCLARFPNCYPENLLENGSVNHLEIDFDESNERQQIPDKRTPAFKLMKNFIQGPIIILI